MVKIKIHPMAFALVCWCVAVFLALFFGSVPHAGIELITQIRLPRVILASAIGIGLSVAGAALQSLFSNPLCDPYTLGVSSGSALGAVLGASLGVEWMIAGQAGTAFLGAMIFAGILYLISIRSSRGNTTLLLTGVMLGFVGNSLVALWIVLSDPNGIQGVLIWLFGDLSRARFSGSIFSALGVSTLSILIWRFSRELDALLMGEEGAAALGIGVPKVRAKIIVLTSILIGICVSASGMIGFVGLVVPHFVRISFGSLHGRLIPLCAIWGAVVLTSADCISRIVVRPYELPVGVVTALMGAPVFIWIMLKKQRIA